MQKLPSTFIRALTDLYSLLTNTLPLWLLIFCGFYTISDEVKELVDVNLRVRRRLPATKRISQARKLLEAWILDQLKAVIIIIIIIIIITGGRCFRSGTLTPCYTATCDLHTTLLALQALDTRCLDCASNSSATVGVSITHVDRNNYTC